VSNLLAPRPGGLAYCPDCADVYGTLDGRSKRCQCPRSEHLVPWQGGDFPTPFEICWCCQAEIIRSGSKWSTYDCEHCRPVMLTWNDRLDEAGLVSFPVGRHSLQHRWRHPRPFTMAPLVAEWKRERPGRHRVAGPRRRDASAPAGPGVAGPAAPVAPSDTVMEALREVNRQLHPEEG
jgi:hypothetical protein